MASNNEQNLWSETFDDSKSFVMFYLRSTSVDDLNLYNIYT